MYKEPVHTEDGWTEQATDAELVARLKFGDEPALVEVYRRHGRRVYPLIRRIVSSDTLAEEVLQDVFVRLWTRPDRYRPEAGPLIAWLLTVARNLSLDALRKEGKWRGNVEIDDQVQDALRLATPAVDGDLQMTVRQLILALPDDQRRTLELAYYSGMTHVELAARLGEPLGTIKSRLRLALDKLRKTLGHGYHSRWGT